MDRHVKRTSYVEPISLADPPLEDTTHQLYTISDLMQIANLSRKQVVYWAQIGLIRPTFRKRGAKTGEVSWFYSRVEVIKALIVSELRRRGFSPRQVSQVAQNLNEAGLELSDTELYLLTDGFSVYYAANNDEIVDVLRNHRQLLLLIPIHEQVAKLKVAA